MSDTRIFAPSGGDPSPEIQPANQVSLELAESLGVVRHTIETFSVGGYRYTNLADAVAQARQMNEPDRTDG